MQNLSKIDLNVGVISNIIFEPYFMPLIKKYFNEKLKLFTIPYGEHNNDEYNEQLNDCNLIVVWVNYESLFPDVWNAIYAHTQTEQQVTDRILFLCKKLYSNLSSYPNVKIIWVLFEDYYENFSMVTSHNYAQNFLVDKINAKLTDMLGDDISIVDLKRLVAKVGIVNAYDSKGKYRWNAPYSKPLIEVAVKEIHKQYLIEKGITKKCLVLDCDNVLWGGVLSEDGIENLKLGGSGFGRAYQDFQRFALSLYYHGVILAVCSKNDFPDVMTMFHEHIEMILKEEHMACFQVNWENKPDNIKRIAETLNISLDSMVFVDDSPVEVKAVKSMLPEVTALLYERDSIYEGLSCFNLKNNVSIADIEKRNKTYPANQSREILKSQYKSYNQYITALEIKIDIHEALPIEYSRISELTQRTNKCTNGRRYTVTEIKERIASKNVKLYSLSVSDRFSDLGLVGALEVEGNALTLFSLSCRALGREIEGEMLNFITDKHQIYRIEFNSTGKNEDIIAVLLQGFPNVTLTNCENALLQIIAKP